MDKSIADILSIGAKFELDHYKEILNTMNDLVSVFDINHNRKYSNKAVADVTGYDLESAIGENAFQNIHPDDIDRLKESIQMGIFEGKPQKAEYRLRHRDGYYLWLEAIGKPFFDREKIMQGYLVIARDITARKNLERELNLTSNVVKNAVEGVFVTDQTGNIIYVNDAFTEITGFSSNEILGANPRVFKSGHHNQEFYRNIWESISANGKWVGEVQNKRKNGDIYVQWTTITRIDDDKGNLYRYACIFSDISERKRAEKNLHDDLELARNIQKSVLSEPINDGHFSVNGFYLPSQKLGGDMYAWYKIDNDRYGVIIIDVMGHGVGSSLVSMSIQSQLRRLITIDTEPIRVFEHLNNHMKMLFKDRSDVSNYFFTAMYLVINIKKQTIQYASAGSPPGLMMTDNNEIIQLSKGGVPLGLLAEMYVEMDTIHYKEGSRILLFTDGLIEEPGKLVSVGLAKVESLFVDLIDAKNEKLPEMIYRKRKEEVDVFLDDITIVSIQL